MQHSQFASRVPDVLSEESSPRLGWIKRRRFLALAAGGVFLAACGGTQATTSQPTAPAAGATAAPAATPAPTTPAAAVAATATPGATQAAIQATSAPAQAAVSSQKVAIEVWNSDWGQLYNDLMKKIGDSFVASNPNIDVHWQFLPQIEQKLLTAYAGGNPPDTHYTNYEFQGSLNYKNVLRPLSPYVQQSGLKREDFILSVYDPCTYKGQLMALPGGADWIVDIYNKDMFKAAGLDPEKTPRSFNELSDASAKIVKKDASGKITQIGFWPQEFVHVLFLFGGSLYDEQSQKVTPTHPKVIEALEWETNLAKQLDMTKVDAFFSGQPGYSKPGSPFGTNRAAFLWNGFWAYDALDKYAPKLNYGITYLPTPTGSTDELKNQQTPWWAYAIPTAAQHPEQAWMFDRYAFIDQAALMGYETLNGPCVLKSLPDWEVGVKKAIGPSNRMTPFLGIFSDVARRATNYFPSIPVASMYADQLNRAFDQAVHGQKQPKDALQAVYDAVQPELEKAIKS